ncbi:hypothetical protein EIN_498340 [Entamoeba invadens IP1]|uniref:Peptidase S59 domain-containing protein n=1 Tax=Entamoeba invadens IP1 TaxID=370355 RepID=A0A0A1UDW2_ENTIV|nr:hypothetical protein EIN_498340 [Entamoeba invadens IP1]ELP94634.1 hypothetical protein EIN_498340 [Entamoeba invadens IP1]|eukprot:XP_004261405.1 hypothetical protein EIN_498340 [Entamoeba invadens IP1]
MMQNTLQGFNTNFQQTNTFTQPSQNMMGNNSLFGQQQQQNTLFTSQNLFGGQQQQQQNNFANTFNQQGNQNLFGTQQQGNTFGQQQNVFGNQQTTNSLFGNTQTGFGTMTQNAQQTGNTFGSNFGGANSAFTAKPQSGLSVFGNTQQNTFGQQPTQPNSLFGNTQQNFFGQQPQGNSLFGNTQQQMGSTNTNMMGNQQQNSLFGSTSLQQGGLGGNLFGQPTQQQQGTGLSGMTQPQMGNSLFGNTPSQIGSNPLMGGQPQNNLFGGNTQQQSGLGGNLFGNSTTSSLFGNQQQSNNLFGNGMGALGQQQNSMFGNQQQSNGLFGNTPGLYGQQQLANQMQQPQLVLPPTTPLKIVEKEPKVDDALDEMRSQIQSKALILVFRKTMHEAHRDDPPQEVAKKIPTRVVKVDETQPHTEEKAVMVKTVPVFKYVPRSHRKEYYSVPSMEELQKMDVESLKHLKSFVFGRTDVGQIEWKNVDITGVNFDCEIQIERGNAIVYPTGTLKQEVGKKLNTEATLTYYHMNKDEEFDSQLERLKKVGEIVQQDEIRGEITIKVQHF